MKEINDQELPTGFLPGKVQTILTTSLITSGQKPIRRTKTDNLAILKQKRGVDLFGARKTRKIGNC